jgi:serine/threonine protein kinase
MLTLVKGKEFINRYVIHDVAGTGGFASVWRASDKQLNRDVALKRLLKHGVSTEVELKQLLDEARKHAQIVHTNIVQVYDVIEIDGEHLIVMEYVDGPSLQTLLRENARQSTLLPLDRAIAILRDVLNGVAFAHDRQTVHRDLSPSNILLTTTGIPKIGDFGIARVIVQAPPTPSKPYVINTEGGTGNPNFMSPEQARGEPADFTSDLFMVGIMGYLLLTGRHPFAHPSGLFAIPELIGDENYRPETPNPPTVLATSQQRLYREYAAVVMRLLNREKAGRFASARDVIEAIEAVTPTLDCPACAEQVPEHSRYCLFCGALLAQPASGVIPSTKATLSPPHLTPDELVEEGFRLSQLKQWNDAIALYKEAIKQDSDHSKAYRNLGFALNQVGRHEEALEFLIEALRHPISARWHEANLLHERSVARASLKDYDGALEDIEKALSLQHDSIKSLYFRARIHLFRGETALARKFAQDVLRREPDHFGAVRLLDQIGEA